MQKKKICFAKTCEKTMVTYSKMLPHSDPNASLSANSAEITTEI